jgi:hypothetical protein
MPLTGVPSATSASAATTSEERMGWNRALETRTLPSGPGCAMRAMNSKNCVERRMECGMLDFLIRFSCATFARR